MDFNSIYQVGESKLSFKSIASKLVKIMDACDYVQKDGKNAFHKYNYVSAANILEKVNAACVQNNVASVVSSKIIDVTEVTTRSGGKERLVTVESTLTLIDGDSGETVTAISLGTGQDPGDKAVAKAQTMALKYAWMTTLNISTGDDPESDEGVDERNNVPKQESSQPKPQPRQAEPDKLTDAQLKKIFATVKELGLPNEEAKKVISEKYGASSTKDLTKANAKDFIDYLENYKKGLQESA